MCTESTHTHKSKAAWQQRPKKKHNSQNKKQAKPQTKYKKGKYEKGKPWKSVANLEAIFE